MKTLLSVGFALVTLTSVRAQVFRPEAVNGAVLGGIAGAVIGNNSGDLHHNGWRGAALGAGAGLLLGETVGNANAAARGSGGSYAYGGSPRVSVGFGYGTGFYGHRGYYSPRSYGGRGWGSRGYGYYEPGFTVGYWPGYSYYGGYDYPVYDNYGYYGNGSAAASGLLLGGLAGGIIGNNSGAFHHSGWRGAAWGAGLGWLLGTVADSNRRVVAPVAPAPVVQAQAQTAAPAQPITIINNYYNSSTPMSGANSLFGR